MKPGILGALAALFIGLLAGCAPVQAPVATPTASPAAARTDFEVVGTVGQADEDFLILELHLYEASGEPTGGVQTLAALDAQSLIPGYESRAILLPKAPEVWLRYEGVLYPVDKSYLLAGQLVGVSAAGETMSIVIYD